MKNLILVMIVASIVFAHEDHKKKAIIPHYDTLTIVNNDTIAINGISINTVSKNKIERGSSSNSSLDQDAVSDVKEVYFSSLFEHIHNKIIHFPIALSVVGFLLMILGYKENKYWNVLQIIIPFAALIGIVAILTGQTQAVPFEGTETYNLVKNHELLGFGVVGSLIFWSISLYVNILEKLVWLFAVFVSLTGLYGGVIAH